MKYHVVVRTMPSGVTYFEDKLLDADRPKDAVVKALGQVGDSNIYHGSVLQVEVKQVQAVDVPYSLNLFRDTGELHKRLEDKITMQAGLSQDERWAEIVARVKDQRRCGVLHGTVAGWIGGFVEVEWYAYNGGMARTYRVLLLPSGDKGED